MPSDGFDRGIDRLVDWLVGDRCPADPCASENGLKNRVYAAIYVPTIALASVSFALTPHIAGTVVFWLTIAWTIGTSILLPPKISEYENCDEVDSHHGEGPA